MEEIQFNKLYNFDSERMYSVFERIRNLNLKLSQKEILTKFLVNQSIGNTEDQISEVLTYYSKKLSENKGLLDLAFEWIRANKIRLEYKKFIPINDYHAYTTALDDLIFLFFQKYDALIRLLFKDTIEEHELCSLYQVFFPPVQSIPENLHSILTRNKLRVPTIIINGKRINITIHTLREGLLDMVKTDHHKATPSDIKIIQAKNQIDKKASRRNFDGTMIERLVKFYCFQNQVIDEKEFGLAINQFLSSYFEYSNFYEFSEFKESLISRLAEFIDCGLTEEYKTYPKENLTLDLRYIFDRFERNLKQGRLKGKAWIDDLKPIIKNFVQEFIEHLKQI